MTEHLSPSSPEQDNPGVIARVKRALGLSAIEHSSGDGTQPEISRGNTIQVVDAQGGGETIVVHIKHPDKDGVE